MVYLYFWVWFLRWESWRFYSTHIKNERENAKQFFWRIQITQIKIARI